MLWPCSFRYGNGILRFQRAFKNYILVERISHMVCNILVANFLPPSPFNKMHRYLYDGYACFNIANVHRAFVLEMVDVRPIAPDGSTYHYRYHSMSTHLVTYFEKLVRSAESHCGEFRGHTTVTRGAALMQTNEVPKISNLANISDFICI